MPIYKRGSVQIHYEEAGSGFPLLVIPGGGLNATIGYLSERVPFNPMVVLSDEYRCITMDLGTPTAADPPVQWRSTGHGIRMPTTSSD